ncbi:MAG: hypothetical protein R3Y45_04420 [Bacillota bacterium]
MRTTLATIPDYHLYEKCKRRLELAGYFKRVETAHEFFQGNQWGDAPPDNMPRPVINIVEPIVSYKVAQISQNGMYPYVEVDDAEVMDAFSARIDKIWEKQDLDNVMYEVLQSAAISGIAAAYCYFDETEKDVVCEVKDARDIIFACETETDIEKQDFIMLPYKTSVELLKLEAEDLGLKPQHIEMIRKDQDDFDDITERCDCVLKFWKEDKKVHFSKFTKHVVLIEDENTGLESYPISIMPWGENYCHIRGLGEICKILQNQIEINKNYARRGVSIMDGAYPRIAYLTDMVENPEAIAEVGSAIGVSGTSVADVAKAITYLSPVRISTDAETYTSELIELTRALAGASDNSIGLVNPEAASGTAILAVQSAQALPLARQVAMMKKFVEKLGRIWLDLYFTYLPSGFTAENGKKISKSQIKDAITHLKVEISSKNPFTTSAVETLLLKYLEMGHISFEEYCNLLPNGGVAGSVLKNYSPKQDNASAQSENLEKMLAQGSFGGVAGGKASEKTNGTNSSALQNAGNVAGSTGEAGSSENYNKLFELTSKAAAQRWSGGEIATNDGTGNKIKTNTDTNSKKSKK